MQPFQMINTECLSREHGKMLKFCHKWKKSWVQSCILNVCCFLRLYLNSQILRPFVELLVKNSSQLTDHIMLFFSFRFKHQVIAPRCTRFHIQVNSVMPVCGTELVLLLLTVTAKSLQSCPTLWDPIPGILQAGTLEWVAISFSNAKK